MAWYIKLLCSEVQKRLGESIARYTAGIFTASSGFPLTVTEGGGLIPVSEADDCRMRPARDLELFPGAVIRQEPPPKWRDAVAAQNELLSGSCTATISSA
jgi:hypothetical protein